MAKTRIIQNNLNAGVISPLAKGRIDIEKYYNGVAVARNVTIMPHGGMRRRDGLKAIDIIAENARLESFEFSTSQVYLMVIGTTTIKVYRNDTLQATVDITAVKAGGLSATQINELDVIQSADTMIIVHEDINPMKLVRGATDALWTLSYITFDYIPRYDYTLANKPLFVNYGVSQVVDVAVDEIVYNHDRNGTAGLDDHLYKAKLFQNNIDLSTADYSNTTNWTDLGAREQAWSSTKGYPRTATFYQGRLWFGGSKSLPSTVFGSVSQDFFNFDTGNGDDNEAIVDTLDSTQFNAINNIISGRALTVFTTGGEFINKSAPITPADSTWTKQTGYGAIRVKAESLDGAIYYVDRTARTVRSFVFEFQEDSFISPSSSLLADHILNDVVDTASLSGSSSDISNLYFVVNGDGTMAVLNTMRTEQISGWTQWDTSGTFKRVTSVGTDMYVLVLRGTNKYCIEKLTSDVKTDHATVGTSGSTFTVTSLPAVNPTQEYRVIADGSILGNEVPFLDGSVYKVTIDRAAVSTVEIGLNFDIEIQTMPLNPQTKEGYMVNEDKRVIKCSLNVYNTLGMYVDDKYISDRQFGAGILNQAPTPFTGVREIYLLGFVKTRQVKVSQVDPLPMCLLQIDMEVEA